MSYKTNAMVYLCGPINGCTDGECNNWRTDAKIVFKNTIDPMRRDYRGVELDSVNEIVVLDKADVRSCNVVLASCPKPSVGTSMEVFYAWTLDIPVVCVVPDGVAVSPWLKYHSTKIVSTFADAYKFIETT